MSETKRLAVDAMGGDCGPETIVEGLAKAAERIASIRFIVFGREDEVRPLIEARRSLDGRCEARHADGVVTMQDKPAAVLRRGRDTSMWAAVGAVADGAADGVLSSGNTGALMAVGRMRLKMIEGVDRPAISALWPTPKGRHAVLDVGANVEVDARQLVQFAVMGEAFYRGFKGVEKPTVGVLNVGAEEQKGHDEVREAARLIRAEIPEMNFHGFVEGDDISKGTVDVTVTDGFTGNIALKTAEGTARLIGDWVREALTGSVLSKLGALLMMPALKTLKGRMDPSNVNGGVFLGLDGLVVKSHGSADAEGVASAVAMCDALMRSNYRDEIASTVLKIRAAEPAIAEAS